MDSKKTGIKKTIKGILMTLLAIVLAVLVLAVSVIYVFEKGPSEEIRDLFVVTVKQSSAAKPLAYLFLSKDEVNEIMANNTAQGSDIISEGEGVDIDSDAENKDDIEIIDIHGPAYNGKLMIIHDPSRVYVYTIPDYKAEHGMTVSEMVDAEGAVGGVNGGGYADAGGMSRGKTPLGFVYSKGTCYHNPGEEGDHLAGFDENNKLVVGWMTPSQARAKGIRDAVSWGPSLVVNGKAVNLGGDGGLNPRTAIGQTADGSVLLLVIDGRQPSSMGASYNDLIGIMLQYGAVNAANLDGGNSTSMVYNGEVLNNVSGLTGERYMPTGVLVK